MVADELTPLQSGMSVEEKAKLYDVHAEAAHRLSLRLMEASDGSNEDEILRQSLDLSGHAVHGHDLPKRAMKSFLVLAILFVGVLLLLAYVGVSAVAPPRQPVGPYRLVQRQEGEAFFDFYNYYEGRDSLGSNGYNLYVSKEKAEATGLVNISMEKDVLDVYGERRRRRLGDDWMKKDDKKKTTSKKNATTTTTTTEDTAANTPKYSVDEEFNASGIINTSITDDEINQAIQDQQANDTTYSNQDMIDDDDDLKDEPFVYMMSAPTDAGPRDAIRLEGKARFNRGLFVIDLRHMPAGCGVWPAFWLTDEDNWPINGEIDVVEGVNYQSRAKTALHSTNGCSMDDVPLGVKTGGWDEAVGIPDGKTGIPDMTLRYATNCYVYAPDQWSNQGCVAVDANEGTLGVPVNNMGGGVYVLEWDPMYRRIRSWVFTPHLEVPENLAQAIRTASHKAPKDRVMPDPDLWPLPYGYFAIGDNTDCPASHFSNMRIVFNLAFCGTVAGNRFKMDCPIQSKKYKTCNDWVKSDPDELKEAYWKIRGVYVYQREWQRAWL